MIVLGLPGFSICVPVPVIRGLTRFLTMAEVAEVEHGVVVIGCVAIFYEEGEGGEHYKRTLLLTNRNISLIPNLSIIYDIVVAKQKNQQQNEIKYDKNALILKLGTRQQIKAAFFCFIIFICFIRVDGIIWLIYKVP